MARTQQGRRDFVPRKRRLRAEMTAPELKLWTCLRSKQFHSLKFRRQHGIGPYIVDFFCSEKQLVIEIDGDSHAEIVQLEKDRQRESYLSSLGLRVIHYTNHEVMTNLDGVLQ